MGGRKLTVSPEPTDEEAAAIAAAIVMAWPRPAEGRTPPSASNRWRFSGRWWAQPGWRRR